jgi:hypothetical protein
VAVIYRLFNLFNNEEGGAKPLLLPFIKINQSIHHKIYPDRPDQRENA